MPKIPIVSAKELIRALQKKGFIHDRTKGSHQIYVNLKTQKIISVPVHKGRTLGKGITHAILKDADISPEEFQKLLRK